MLFLPHDADKLAPGAMARVVGAVVAETSGSRQRKSKRDNTTDGGGPPNPTRSDNNNNHHDNPWALSEDDEQGIAIKQEPGGGGGNNDEPMHGDEPLLVLGGIGVNVDGDGAAAAEDDWSPNTAPVTVEVFPGLDLQKAMNGGSGGGSGEASTTGVTSSGTQQDAFVPGSIFVVVGRLNTVDACEWRLEECEYLERIVNREGYELLLRTTMARRKMLAMFGVEAV